MVKIDWDEFKEYKKYGVRNDNFETLIDFMKSYYNVSSPAEIYETFVHDVIAQMMLEKRNITSAESLEDFLFKFR